MQIQTETWSGQRDELTSFLICVITQQSDHIIPIHEFQTFLFPVAFLSFSECLNAMPGVLVAGSERREDKNKEI